MCKMISYKILSVFVILSIIISVSIYSYADEVTDNQTLPNPVKVVDFSYDYDELEEQDVDFKVVENDASPILIEDKEMGQVLQLKKAIISDEEALSSVESKDTQYSQINISNPYADLDYLVECEPYEEVDTIEYQYYLNKLGLSDRYYITQPYWKTGITISYWIKSPSSVNSNVVGFSGYRFQMDLRDYSNYLMTVKFDLEYASMTDEERNVLDLGPSGVLPDSDFYFDYLYEDNGEITTYKGKPVYISPEKMGKYYWMNKFYETGYVVDDASYVNPRKYYSDSYEMYCEAPYLGESEDDHDPGKSILRYGWVDSGMFLDATSSFYYTNQGSPTTQLNPNHATSYNTKGFFTVYNYFNINSWKSADTYEEAVEKGTMAPSPVSLPDKWHNVTVIIQNDWVKYYLDGAEIDIEDNYSTFGLDSLDTRQMPTHVWKHFNRGAGARYGYGAYSGKDGYTPANNLASYRSSPTIMGFLTHDSTKLCIGGGNLYGDGCLMFAETDEILLKNVVFYDCMLTEEQITELAEKPFIYDKDDSKRTFNGATAVPENILGDVDFDKDIDANDALQVLKYVAKLDDLTDVQKSAGDVDGDKKISPKDALYILKKAAVIIDSFPIEEL